MRFRFEKLIHKEEFERVWSEDYKKDFEHQMLNEIGYESAKQTITIEESDDERGKMFRAEIHAYSAQTMHEIAEILREIKKFGNYETQSRVPEIARLLGLM